MKIYADERIGKPAFAGFDQSLSGFIAAESGADLPYFAQVPRVLRGGRWQIGSQWNTSGDLKKLIFNSVRIGFKPSAEREKIHIGRATSETHSVLILIQRNERHAPGRSGEVLSKLSRVHVFYFAEPFSGLLRVAFHREGHGEAL